MVDMAVAVVVASINNVSGKKGCGKFGYTGY